MKKSILTLLFITSIAFAQEPKKEHVKQDTIFVLSFKDLKEYVSLIDRNIDSKSLTRELIAFIEKRVMLVQKQPADKPKINNP